MMKSTQVSFYRSQSWSPLTISNNKIQGGRLYLEDKFSQDPSWKRTKLYKEKKNEDFWGKKSAVRNFLHSMTTSILQPVQNTR